ncbi:MAG: UbiD family decarboxylase, partial [Tepidanaerobacteraceae bacterium]
FEIVAIQQKLEDEDRYPILRFKNVKNLYGEPSGFEVVTNVFAHRKNCALALDLSKDQWRMETSLEYARRAMDLIKPVVVDKSEAPCKEVIMTGDEVDLYKLPVQTHHEMDGMPYLPDAVVAADPDTGIYNSSHHRMIIAGKDESRIWMSPRHLWNYFVRAEERGEPLPIAHVLGHHPGFFLGSESILPITTDEYEVIGGILQEPLRLVPSETYGERLMVPADAEIVIEGEILPNCRAPEGPFGEFTGYYGPQRWSPVVKIKAITHRKNPIFLNILCGHPDTWLLGGIAKEACLYEELRRVCPGVTAVHLPTTGTCRFHAYVAIKQRFNGEAKVAGIATIPHHDIVKHIVVVDDDIDPFDEKQVLWAIATRVQADKDVTIIPNCRGGLLDPSSVIEGIGAKMVIDATKPMTRPFAEKIAVPKDVT